jgi:hypothetical protein
MVSTAILADALKGINSSKSNFEFATSKLLDCLAEAVGYMAFLRDLKRFLRLLSAGYRRILGQLQAPPRKHQTNEQGQPPNDLANKLNEVLALGNSSGLDVHIQYKNFDLKQYIKEGRGCRTEGTFRNPTILGSTKV